MTADPATGYAATPSGYEPGRDPGAPYWDGPAGDEMRRLDRLALDELAALLVVEEIGERAL